MKYTITVKPGSKKGPLIIATAPYELTVYLRERPIEGRANLALAKLLAEHFCVPKTSIVLCSGARSRKKVFEIPKS